MLIAGLSVLATLLVLLAIPGVRNAVLPAPAKESIAVLPFTNNLGSGPDQQALVDGMLQSLTGVVAGLSSHDASFWVVPAEELVQRNVNTASEAHKLFGVERVLTGSVQREGEKVELVLNVVDAADLRILETQRMAAELGPEFRDQARGLIAEVLGVRGLQ